VRKKRLLEAFGSVAAIRRAGLDEIAAVKGMTPALAATVKAAVAPAAAKRVPTPADPAPGAADA
jgi:excinuclease ABC subunit C